MRLTPFSHAALCILAGILVSLLLSKFGIAAYATTVALLAGLVLVREWSVGARPGYQHEVERE